MAGWAGELHQETVHQSPRVEQSLKEMKLPAPQFGNSV